MTGSDLAGDWSGLIVVCSGMPWDGPTMSDKQVATRLTDYAPVLFVDPPLSLLRMLRNRSGGRGLTRLGPRLVKLTPVVNPGVSRPGLRTLARFLTRRAVGRAARRLGGDTQAVMVASLDNLFGACHERVRLVYGTDDFAAAGELMGLSTSWLLAQEQAQLARANELVAISEPLAERWRELGYSATVIPNGCDVALYADVASVAPAADITLPAPIAGVIGHLSERLDMDYLEAVAATGHSLLLVGPRSHSFEPARMTALIERPNVQWVGAKPAADLPSYLTAMRVGLTPYADSTFNRASFPLKTLEYLAAGRAAVSTDLPASRWLDTDLVDIAGTPAEFARITVERLTQPDSESNLAARRRRFAEQHSWERRVQEFLPLLGIVDRPG